MLGLRLVVRALPSLMLLSARCVVSKTRVLLLPFVVLVHIRCTAPRKECIFGVYAGCINMLRNTLLVTALTACSPDELSAIGAASPRTTLPALRLGLEAVEIATMEATRLQQVEATRVVAVWRWQYVFGGGNEGYARWGTSVAWCSASANLFC